MIKILKYGEVPNSEIFARGTAAADVSSVVSDIIGDVRSRGDEALFEYCKKFDKAELSSLAVSEEEIDEAFASVEPRFIEILKKAAANIRKFHEQPEAQQLYNQR